MKRVQIRELAGWDLDDYEYRPSSIDALAVATAKARIARRRGLVPMPAVLATELDPIHALLKPHASRTDLLEEMSGLTWSLGLVNLEALIAFQRRLYFPDGLAHAAPPAADDWPALVAHAFAEPKPPVVETIWDRARNQVTIRSDNPNTHIRVTSDPTSPVVVHTGSPFFEVANYKGRWFLRDGYHRAYALLSSGVCVVPAVIVQANTLEELGCNQPWFFPEPLLLSDNPPLVTDFLVDDLVVHYDRPQLVRNLRLTIEDTLTPETNTGEPT